MTKVHTHYSAGSGCSTLNGSTEYGTILVENNKLIFNVQSGTAIAKNGCNPSLSWQNSIKPRKESFLWSIQTNVNHNNVQALCWNLAPDKAE